MEWETSHVYKVNGAAKLLILVGDNWVNASRKRYRDGSNVSFHKQPICFCLEPTREGLTKASCTDMKELWKLYPDAVVMSTPPPPTKPCPDTVSLCKHRDTVGHRDLEPPNPLITKDLTESNQLKNRRDI